MKSVSHLRWQRGRGEHVAAGEVIATAGSPFPALVLVVTGELVLWRGDAPPLHLGPGATFGAGSVLRTRPLADPSRKFGPRVLVVLDRSALLILCRRRPVLGVVLLERLCAHLSNLD